eukprot:2814365-Prymnesium_polylepis.1
MRLSSMSCTIAPTGTHHMPLIPRALHGLEVRHRAACEGRGEGLHALVTDLVAAEHEFLEFRYLPADEGCTEGFQALIADLVAGQVELLQLRQRAAGKGGEQRRARRIAHHQAAKGEHLQAGTQ